MAETRTKKHMPFSPVRVKRQKPEEGGRRLTERQLAAQRRQKEENHRARQQGGVHKGAIRLRPENERITGMIADELTRAFAVILKLDGPSDQLMKAFFKSNPKLGSRDRTILAEAIFYGLRHLAGIAWRMKPIPPDRAPRVAALITLALQYGPQSMSDAVYGRDKASLENMLRAKFDSAPGNVRAEMPQWLYERIVAQYGMSESNAIFEASAGNAPLDLRVNTLKVKREQVLEELGEHRVEASPTPFSPDGLRLVDKPGLISWPMYREGRIEVQDEGSQLIARLVAPKRGDMVCDFCAGAGGKTLVLGAMMRSKGRLYAFDVNEKRLAGLTPRMRRAGLSNIHPIAIRNETDDRIKRLRGKFDRVLVDAPCTGTGTLRRNPDLKWRLNTEELARINSLQHTILEEASKLLKVGGRLVYATCSMLQQENQDVITEFLSTHPDFALVNATDVLAKQDIRLPEWQKERFGDYLVLLPNLHDTDGFFGAVLEKIS